jgi:hypothetical protein
MVGLAEERLVSSDDMGLVCLVCGDTMKQVRTIPRLGLLRQLAVFVCPSCNQVLTIGLEEQGPRLVDRDL